MSYDNSKSLLENAIAGVDITEPELPTDIDLTGDKDFRTPDNFMNSVNEFLCDKYGQVPMAYDYEIKITDIMWGDEI